MEQTRQAHSWVLQIADDGREKFMERMIDTLNHIRVESHAGAARRDYLDRLIAACEGATRIGTGGTVGTDNP